MFNFFDSLIGLIGSLIDTIGSAITTLLKMHSYAINGLAFLQQTMLFLPAFVAVPVGTLLALAVIKFIMNFGKN